MYNDGDTYCSFTNALFMEHDGSSILTGYNPDWYEQYPYDFYLTGGDKISELPAEELEVFQLTKE